MDYTRRGDVQHVSARGFESPRLHFMIDPASSRRGSPPAWNVVLPDPGPSRWPGGEQSTVIDAYLPTLTPKVGIAIGLTSLAGIGTVFLFVRARLIFPGRRCTRCGYDRTHATSDRCTECGTRPSTSAWRLPPTSTFLMMGLLWVTLLTWPAYKAYRWCEVRNWTPPLPRYSTEVLRRYSTGHVLVELNYRSHFEPGFPFSLELRDAAGEVRIEWTCWSCRHGMIRVDLNVPEDIDGDGLPDIMFSRESGGNGGHEDYSYHRLHPNGEVEHVWYVEGFHDTSFRDYDGDGVIERRDVERYRYTYACGACLSARAITYSEWDGIQWVLEFDLMRQPPPSDEDFIDLVERLRDQPWSTEIPTDGYNPYWTPSVRPLWEKMLELVHEGNGRTAAALHAAVWPTADAPDREDALAYFVSRISPRIATWSGLGKYARASVEDPSEG